MTEHLSAAAKAPTAPNKPVGEGGQYAMPEFVEDVNWCERLILPDDLSQADWPAWTAAMLRRIRLATSASQLANLMSMNHAGLQACPWRHRGKIGAALADVAACTQDQTAGA